MPRDVERDYHTMLGHPPPIDETDDAWQWEYQGRSEEDKQRLQELARVEEKAQQEETLF